MNRRSLALLLPAAAVFMYGCKSSKSGVALDNESLDALRSMEAAIGGLEMGLNNMRDSTCGDMATAMGGSAASVRESFNALKISLGSPNL